MRADEIIERAHKLFVAYFNKYGREPNAIVLCEKDYSLLSTYNENWQAIKVQPKEVHSYCLMGMKIIPVKYGEMQVYEEIW